MQPTRSRSRFGLPTPRGMATKIALAMIAFSVLWYVIRRNTGISLYLEPGQIIDRLWVFQLLTFLPAEQPQAMSVLFSALILWSIGGGLEAAWGGRRLLWYMGGIAFGAGVLTTLLSLVVPSVRDSMHFGAGVASGAIWVAYGLHFGRTQINFWGLPVTGNVFALIGVAFVALNAIFSPWQMFVAEAFGLALAFAYVRVGSPGVFLLRFQSWRLQRELKQRSKHLRVIENGRNMPRDSDRYLH